MGCDYASGSQYYGQQLMQSDGSSAATQVAATFAVSPASKRIVCTGGQKLAESKNTEMLPNACLVENITALPLQCMTCTDLEDDDEALLLDLDTEDEALLDIMPWPNKGQPRASEL